MWKLLNRIGKHSWAAIRAFTEINVILHGLGLSLAVVWAFIFSYCSRFLPFLKTIPVWTVFLLALLIPLLIATTSLLLWTNYNLQRYRSGESHFLRLARANAVIDARLFRFLFVQVTAGTLEDPRSDKRSLRQREVTLESIEKSLQTTNENIVEVLEFLKQLMDDYTREPCATCVKLLGPPDMTANPPVPTLRVTGRDALSKSRRGSEQSQNVMSNTAFVKILFQRKQYFASNNLKQLAIENEYENTRTNWQSLYNSSVVVPIPNPLNIESELGFLCVDSLNGKLDNECCIHYTMELSCRLAVLVFRLSALETQREAYRSRRDELNDNPSLE